MVYRIGADIGGTSVKLGVVDEEFHIVESMRIPTGEICTADGIIEGIIDGCRGLMARYEIASVGIGSAGLVNPETGYVLRAGNLPFADEPVAARIAAGLDMPVFLDNDANCALIGEHAAGACRGFADALILTIGTGIGGAVMIGGHIYRGHNYKAAEFGHFVIDMRGKACSCGLRGCFEMYGSASALIAMTKKCVRAFPGSLLAKEAEGGIDGSTAFCAAKSGCAAAEEMLKDYGKVLALGINSLVKIFQPQVVVLSGGVAVQGDYLLGFIKPNLVEDAVVCTTRLGGGGGLIGAALLGTCCGEQEAVG